MGKRKTKFYDIPVHKNTIEKVKKAKGEKSYDEFLNEILEFDFMEPEK